MAEVKRLRQFDDLSLIGRYAERFGLDPDYVFAKTRFDTLMAFTALWKEEEEYRERYEHLYIEITKDAKE